MNRSFGFVGLENQGATCYLNSLIQTLFMIPEFRRGLYTLQKHDFEVEEKEKETPAKRRKIPEELQRLFARLQMEDVASISTSGLTQSFGWNDAAAYQQQDVAELYRVLLDAIDRSLKSTPCSNLVSELFRISNVIECSECKYTSERFEDSFDFTVQVDGYRNIHDSLLKCIETETLEGDNKYMCSRCQKKVKATRGARFSRLAPILTFSLLRYRYDWEKGIREKISDRFDFPLKLNMSPFIHENKDENLEYDLHSVIVHRGVGARAGHYHAILNDVLQVGKWSKEAASVKSSNTRGASKGKNSSVKSSDNGSFCNTSSSPEEIIVNILKLHAPSYTLNLDRVAGEFLRLTGRSWNVTYKKKYGSMQSFISKRSAVFVLKNQDVCLVSGIVLDFSKLNICEDVKDDRLCESWFDFNDANIKPVMTSQIEESFGSASASEVAYMLVYRRHLKISDNSVPSVPDHLLAELRETIETRDLEENIITLIITRLGVEFGKNSSQLNITVSNLITVAKLREILGVSVSEIPPEIMDLYAFIDNDLLSLNTIDGNQTLSELSIADNCEIFVEVLQDESQDSQAKSLVLARKGLIELLIEDRCSCSNQSYFPVFKFGLAKDCTLSELKIKVLDMISEESRTCVFTHGSRFKLCSGKLLDKEEMTANQLSFYSGQKILFESKPLPLKGEIYVRYAVLENERAFEISEFTIFDLIINQESTVFDLKTNMIYNSGSNIDCSKCKVRPSTKKNQPAINIFDDTKSLSFVGIQNGALLFLDPLKTKQKNHIALKLFGNSRSKLQIFSDETNSESLLENPLYSPLVPRILLSEDFDISIECTVEALRLRIFEELKHPEGVLSPDFIRLSVISGNPKLGRQIIRLMNQPLKHYGYGSLLTSSNEMMVEYLENSENLQSNSVNLSIYRRRPDTRSFDARVEYQFLKSSCSTVDAFIQQISKYFEIPSTQLQVFLYSDKKSNWHDITTIGSIGKKSKTRVTALDLFSDSSQIAILDTKELKTEDDMSTPWDRLTQENQMKRKENNKKISGDNAELVIDVEFD